MPVRRLLKYVAARQAPAARLPAGRRIYAVGDIHGRRDLLDELLDRIAADSAARGEADTLVVFLGDLIDRGPESRGVVERLMRFRDGPVRSCFLMGNHEEVFLKALDGDLKALKFLVRIGGRETIMSYGIGEEDYRALDFEDLMASLRAKVPADHVAFLAGFERFVEAGDYLFVHAGIRPGIAIEEQAGSDLRWIRDDFLRHREDFGKVVVHGHSITEDVDMRPNRIGIDTGAYMSGKLTAIGLEGAERWFLATGGAPN